MSAPKHPNPSRRRVILLTLTLTLVVLVALPTASAWAGRVLVTGHDADLHCSGGSIDSGQCHYVAVALAYVRGGAPTPTRKVLAIDKGGLALDRSLTSLGIPHDTVDPTSPAFAGTALNTSTYSAIAVASDASCGGCDLNDTPSATSQTPDSDAINARASAIASFFNAGGGVIAFSGADHGDGSASSGPDTYYSFIPVPVGGAAVASPFTLTAAGRAIGLEDARAGIGTHNDINCCATHNSFTQPGAGSALQSAENDSQGLAETLIASGQISGGELVSGALPAPVLAKTVNVATLRGTVYVSVPARSAFASLAVPGIKGRRFVPLTKPRQIPVGAFLDTRKGTVALGSASTKAGQFFTGSFSGGVFAALQSRTGLTSLPLKGSSFRSCTARAGRASAALTRRVIRRMRSSASGRFRTSGRYSAATVRGTIWQTIDRCDGTLTKVTRGTVVVRDFRKRRNITVRAGKSYLARAPG
jgi:hypothetical protein